MGLDLRIPPSYTEEQVRELIESWVQEETGIDFEYSIATDILPPSEIDDDEKTWWHTFKSTIGKFSDYSTEIFSAGTDSRYFR